MVFIPVPFTSLCCLIILTLVALAPLDPALFDLAPFTLLFILSPVVLTRLVLALLVHCAIRPGCSSFRCLSFRPSSSHGWFSRCWFSCRWCSQPLSLCHWPLHRSSCVVFPCTVHPLHPAFGLTLFVLALHVDLLLWRSLLRCSPLCHWSVRRSPVCRLPSRHSPLRC